MDIKISINNWEKYNGRKDVDNPSWFRFQIGFFQDNKIKNLSNEEKIMFIWLLCEAARNNNQLIFLGDSLCLQLNLFASHKTNLFTNLSVNQAIKKFKALQLVTCLAVRQRNADGTLATATEQDKTEHNNLAHFDFEVLYQKYPKKLGKTAGIKILKSTIKTYEDYQLLSKAIDNIAQDSIGKDIQFVPYFSSFVGTVSVQKWRDWVDYKPVTLKPRNIESEYR